MPRREKRTKAIVPPPITPQDADRWLKEIDDVLEESSEEPGATNREKENQ